jgi:FHA domain
MGIELAMSAMMWTMGMSPQTLIRPAAEGITERVDPVSCLNERTLSQASEAEPGQPGRYLEVQGSERTLLIPVGSDVIHIGRGLAADLHLDESSVSRRHAILVPRVSGARVLDDRSSNGTFVNGRRVQQADLANGDVIVIGRVVLRYLEL